MINTITQLDIQIKTPATLDEIAVVETGLQNFNNTTSTIIEVRPLHVIATGKSGAVYGGAIGRTWGECCELLLLWVDDSHKGKGAGTLLMDSFELEAAKRSCHLVYLDTFSFQAPIFYEKRGYTEISRITGFSGGEEKLHMQKKINL